MDLTIPILNEVLKRPGEKRLIHRLSPVFMPDLVAEDEYLSRAKTRLLTRVRARLDSAGRSWSHHALTLLAANPELRCVKLKVEIELRRRIARVPVLVIVLQLFEREVAWFPKLRELWFDLTPTQTLEKRTTEVLQAWFREQEKESPDDPSSHPESIAAAQESWVSPVSVSVRNDPVSEQELEKTLMALFSNETMDGATELSRVGRCLDHQYPDDLNRAVFRETEVEELENLLQRPTRQGIVLLGPTGVGKTTLIHELVYRHVARQTMQQKRKRNFWSLSPQRLISGMMYVGQWENRLLAILKEAKKRGHWLCFEDLLSMFRAGQSRDSKLCVADLIRNTLVAGDVRIIAEMTLEAWHVLNTKHQGFADLLHPVRIWPTSQDLSRKIAVQTLQQLEIRHRCSFLPNVVPQIMQLEQSHGPAAALPGRIIAPLKSLAIRHQHSSIHAAVVLDYYQTATGLQRSLLTQERTFSETEFFESLRQRVVGQQEALQVLSQVVSSARARMQEGGRPLGTLLFLGPTGVGKTECAKAVCDALFQSRDYLVRFDLNQFKSAYAAATLVGTPDHPTGLLTAAVRQRPFCVLLLDEIEKAHRAVHDLLLQVLGEGRLTDAEGQTTDFSKCLIIMTSNLGTQGHRRGIGFNSADHASHYLKAAQSFFRPEFFNRIDDVVPFAELTHDEVQRIAGQMVAAMIGREGLSRRQCVLHVEPAAMDAIVQWGYHPELGARAMKRALEDHLARPVAMQLAALPIDEPTLVRVYPQGRLEHEELPSLPNPAFSAPVSLHVEARGFEQVARVRAAQENWAPAAVANAVEDFLLRFATSHVSPMTAGPWSVSNMNPEMIRYFAINEQLHRVQEELQELRNTLAQKPQPEISFSGGIPVRRKVGAEYSSFNPQRFGPNERRFFHEILAADDLNDYLTESSAPVAQGQLGTMSQELVDECVLLESLRNSNLQPHIILFARYFNDGSYKEDTTTDLSHLGERLTELVKSFGIDYVALFQRATEIEPPRFAILLRGVCIQTLADWMTGSYLNIEPTGGIGLIQVIQLPHDCLPTTEVLDQISEHDLMAWCRKFERECRTTANSTSDPCSIRPVVQIAHRRKTRLDLRSQWSFPDTRNGAEWREIFLRGLPLPTELQTIAENASLKNQNTNVEFE